MMSCPVSAIITTYNEPHLLARAIESVLAQSVLPQELIVVDDGSTEDEAGEVVEQYARRHASPVIRFHRKPNGGPSSARNVGIRMASHDNIAFLDGDDEMLRNCIGSRYEVLRDLPADYFGVYGPAVCSDQTAMRFIDYDGVPRPEMIGHLGTGLPGGSCFYLFRRQPLMDIGGYDEELINNEDFDLLLRLARAGLRCRGSVGDAGILVHLRPGSLSRSTDADKVFQHVWRFLEKARKNAYFPMEELRERQKAAYLALARRTMLANPRRGGAALRAGFDHAPPRRAKEWAAYLLSRFL